MSGSAAVWKRGSAPTGLVTRSRVPSALSALPHSPQPDRRTRSSSHSSADRGCGRAGRYSWSSSLVGRRPARPHPRSALLWLLLRVRRSGCGLWGSADSADGTRDRVTRPVGAEPRFQTAAEPLIAKEGVTAGAGWL